MPGIGCRHRNPVGIGRDDPPFDRSSVPLVAQQQVEAVGVTPAMPPTEVTPGVTMMFLTDPDAGTVELVEFASGVSTHYANLDVPSAN